MERERTIRDQGVRWRMREVAPKPGRFPPFLKVLVIESEAGRYWTTIATDTLRLPPGDLLDMVVHAKPIPPGKVIAESPPPKTPAEEIWECLWR